MISPWSVGLGVALAIAAAYALWRVFLAGRDRRRRREHRAPAPAGGSREAATPQRLLRRAEAAVTKLREQTDAPEDPLLRAQVGEIDDQAAGIVVDLRRLAERVTALERSLQDIQVDRLRRELATTRRSVADARDPQLRAELERAARSLSEQLAVADRLDTARRTLLARIETAVFDLEGLGVRVTELIVMHGAVGGDDADARLTELTGDVESMRAGLAEARGLSSTVLDPGGPAATGPATDKPAADGPGTNEPAANEPATEPPPPAAPEPEPEPGPATAPETERAARPAAGRGRPRWDIVAGVVAVVLIATCFVNQFVPRASSRPGAAGPGGCAAAIGFLGRLSGDDAGDGQTEYDAVALAVEQDNAAHGGECRIQLQKYDTNITDGTAASATAIVADAGVLAVIGPTYAAEVADAMPVLEPAGVTVISPSASDTYLAGSGWKTFHRTLPSDDEQAAAAVRFLRTTIRARRTFVVSDDSSFGTAVAPRVTEQLRETLAGQATVTTEQADYAAAVGQIQAAGADAVYFSGTGEGAGRFVRQLRAAAPAVTVIGGDRLMVTSFFDTAGPAADGVYATCPCVPVTQGADRFRTQFNTRYGDAPGYYAPEAYDAARIVLSGIRAGRTTRPAMLAWVDAYDGEGITRHLRFGPGGALAAPQPNVWAYKGNGGYFRPQAIVP